MGNMTENGQVKKKMAEQIVAYQLGYNLYLNITNRCTNNCLFCIRNTADGVGYDLWLAHEPSLDEVINAVKDPTRYREVVFCGYGEPLMRVDLVKEAASEIKKRGGIIRINTNGQANLIHGRNVIPELKGTVDTINISLNAQSAEQYIRICRPSRGAAAYRAVLDFARLAVEEEIPRVILSVVQWPGVNVEQCRQIATGLGAEFRLRQFSGRLKSRTDTISAR